MPQVGVFVPVSAIFPELTADFATFCSLVRSLSRTDTLFWCARLNLVLSNPENHNRIGKQDYGLRLFFDQEQIGLLDRFTEQHGGAERVSVFLRAQLLELMRWTCLLAEDHRYDGNTFEDPHVRRRFVQAALIASDLWGKRAYGGKLVSTGNVPEDRRRALPAIRQGSVANASPVELMQVLARGVSVYRESFQRGYKDAAQEFRIATGLTFDEYMACLVAITSHFARVAPQSAEHNPGGFHIDAIKSNLTAGMALAMDRYIWLESQTPDDLRTALWRGRHRAEGLTGTEPFDQTPLRARPILRTADGRCIILDQAFYGERASVGPLFTLVSALGKSKKINTAFGAFGAAFEAYVNSLLCTMYPSASSPLLFDRLTCNLHGKTNDGNDVEIADACLNDVTEVVLFEIKAAFIREDSTSESDVYEQELRKKYGVSAGSANERGVKGVGQLARSIRRIAVGELTPGGPTWQQVKHIFPVLVVYDVSLNSPGHAEFFEEEFRTALNPESVGPTGFMQKGPLNVAPLTVMTIEDLENLESSVQHFRLIDFLRDYASTTRGGVRLSLHDFMASNQKKYRLIYSKELAGRAMKVLEETVQMMFLR
ncbi:hypothetical protein [Sorangium sp. So ce1151]|uniref:hypothetical protein n=1 Tax=Sorangium sp. So ce1151 TaxID=3133332 RepID=UPI003F5EEEDD